MAWRDNTAARAGRVLSVLVCVFAVLLATTPCAAQAGGMMTMSASGRVQPLSAPAADCAPCCNHSVVTATSALCCAQATQPAEQTLVQAAPDVLAASNWVTLRLLAPRLTVSLVAERAMAPPTPPLHPVLRI